MYKHVPVREHIDTCVCVCLYACVYTCARIAIIQCVSGLGLQPRNLGGSGWAPPNGDIAVDSLISAMAHETAESATDPDTRSGYFSK